MIRIKDRLVNLAIAYRDDKLYYPLKKGGYKKANTINLPRMTVKEFLDKYLTENEVNVLNGICDMHKQEELQKRDEIEELKMMVDECMTALGINKKKEQ